LVITERPFLRRKYGYVEEEEEMYNTEEANKTKRCPIYYA